MFNKKDIETLTEVFAAARSYIVTTQPKNRDGLAGLLNFETDLTAKMSESLVEEEVEVAEEVEDKEA
tara:strand:- start:301 stop:501 length:201 start_codon:yes stop_codon:yes gene_type:complete